MINFVIKTLFKILATDKVKEIVKDTIKDNLTSKTDTKLDDKFIDIVFDSDEKARDILFLGANTLLKTKNEYITNDIVNDFLKVAKKSKGNGITSIIQNNIKNNLLNTEDKLYINRGL